MLINQMNINKKKNQTSILKRSKEFHFSVSINLTFCSLTDTQTYKIFLAQMLTYERNVKRRNQNSILNREQENYVHQKMFQTYRQTDIYHHCVSLLLKSYIINNQPLYCKTKQIFLSFILLIYQTLQYPLTIYDRLISKSVQRRLLFFLVI